MSHYNFNWSSKEKNRFFSALARRGRYNTQAIAKDLPSRTEAEIVAYIHLLENARNEISKVLPLHISSYPTAREIPDTVIQWEEREVEEKRRRETRGLKKLGLQKGLLYMKGRARGIELDSETLQNAPCKKKKKSTPNTNSKAKRHSVFNASKASDIAKIAYTQKPTAIARPTLHAIQNALLDWLIPTVRDIGYAALERRNMSKRSSKNQQTVSVFDESVEAALLLQSRRKSSTCRTRQEEYECLDRIRHMYRNHRSKEEHGDKEDSVEVVPEGLSRGKKRRRDDDIDVPSLIENGIVNTVSDPDNVPQRNIKRLRTTSEYGNNNRNRELELQMETTMDHDNSTITEDEDTLSDWERELHEEAHLEFYEREKDRRFLRKALPRDVVSLLDKETGKIGTTRTRFRMTKPDPFEIDCGNRCCVRGCSFRSSQIQDDDETSDSDWWSMLQVKRNKWGMPVMQRQDIESAGHGSKKNLEVDDLLDDWTSDSSTSESSDYSSTDMENDLTAWTPTGCVSPASSSPPESVSYEGYFSPPDSDVADGEDETDQSDGWVDDSESDNGLDREFVGNGQTTFWKPDLVSGEEASSDAGRDEWNYGEDLVDEVDEEE